MKNAVETSKTSSAEMDRLFSAMPGDDAARVLALADALRAFARTRDKAAAARELSARLAPLGYRGLSLKSLYRKLDGLRAEGAWALAPAKYRRDDLRGIAANEAFLAHWHGLVLENRRKFRPAWRRLVREFAAGADVPGVGTWRELYLRERGCLPAEGEPCPWDERTPPPGWSFRNLSKFVPDPFALAAARRGMAEAKAAYGLAVRKTRAGLACCRIVEVDDMFYEHSVVFAGNRGPQRVVEFAAMDRLTAHVVWHLPKPVRERADGTRETLRQAWAKYVYHAVLCVSGIPPEGCIIQGEKGSATSDPELERALALVNAWRAAQGLGKVEFRTGALANAPLAKGLPDGAAKGNPRHKGMIEQMHATLKNEMGHVLGEVGGGRGVQPEETGALVAETRRLVAMAEARGLRAEAVAAPFLSWPAFVRAAEEAHRSMDERTDHALEGWEACGFVAGEVRLKGEASWRSVKAMGQMTPEEAGAVAALVRAGAAEYRERRLSPREAWERSKGVLAPVPAYFSPLILGGALCAVARVRDGQVFRYRDPNIGSAVEVAAVVDGRVLTRGREYRVWVNPLDGDKAYVCGMDGTFLGVAKVLRAVRADATADDLAEQLGLRQAVLAEEARRLAPVVRRRRAAANARAAANIAALGLADPVAARALERAAPAPGVTDADFDDDGAPEPPAGGPRDDDFI